MSNQLDFKKMLQAGIHFGHKTSRWSPKMRPYIWGAKNRIHLIDISKTAILLERAGSYLKELAQGGGQFIFVGTKKAAQPIIKKTALSLKQPYVINRWVGGTLSNYDQVKKAVTRLLHLRDVVSQPTTHYKKKEMSMIQKELARLEKNVGGIIDLAFPPAAIVVVDAKKESSVIKEAASLGIPVIAMVDTNTDPKGVSCLIPSNDDSPKAIEFVLSYLQSFISEGIEAHKQNVAAEKEAAQAKREQEKKARAEKAEAAKAKVAAKKTAAPKKDVEKAPEKVSSPKAKAVEKSAKAMPEKEEAKQKAVKKTAVKKVATKKAAVKKAAAKKK